MYTNELFRYSWSFPSLDIRGFYSSFLSFFLKKPFSFNQQTSILFSFKAACQVLCRSSHKSWLPKKKKYLTREKTCREVIEIYDSVMSKLVSEQNAQGVQKGKSIFWGISYLILMCLAYSSKHQSVIYLRPCVLVMYLWDKLVNWTC